MAAGFLGLSAPTASADSVVSRIDVYSPSMDRWIANDVISRPEVAPRRPSIC